MPSAAARLSCSDLDYARIRNPAGYSDRVSVTAKILIGNKGGTERQLFDDRFQPVYVVRLLSSEQIVWRRISCRRTTFAQPVNIRSPCVTSVRNGDPQQPGVACLKRRQDRAVVLTEILRRWRS